VVGRERERLCVYVSGSSEGDRVNLIQYLILTLSFTFKLSQSLKWLIYYSSTEQS